MVTFLQRTFTSLVHAHAGRTQSHPHKQLQMSCDAHLEMAVKSMKSPYKKSIWDVDERYDITDLSLTDHNASTVSMLMSVDAAKKNTPPIPIKGLLRLSELASDLPVAMDAHSKVIKTFLKDAQKVHGAGMATILCMLSVTTNGEYAPMDKKFSAGLLKQKKITKADRKVLTGSSAKKIAEVYVNKVLPAWTESRVNRTPKEADDYWGRVGIDG